MARRKRKASLAGTHLYQDSRNGNYIWRRKCSRTGRRLKRSTGTNHLSIALRKSAEFEEDYEKQKAGIPTFAGWKQDLARLAAEWITFQEREGTASPPVISAKRFRIERGLRELELSTPADLGVVPGHLGREGACTRPVVPRRRLRNQPGRVLQCESIWRTS